MPSSMDLASRLATIVAAQQEILAAVNDDDRVMQLIAERAPEITGGSGAVLELVDEDEMVYRAASGPARTHVGLYLPIEGSLSGRAIRERQLLRCEDTETDPRVDLESCRRIGIRSMIIAPLLDGQRAVGALKTFSPHPNAFTDLDAYCVQLLAGICASAVVRAQEFRDRRESEERYRLLFERNIAGVFRSTPDGRFLDCNEAFAGYLGYDSRDELLASPAWDFYVRRSDRENLVQSLQAGIPLTNVRLPLKRKDGSSVVGLVNASMIAADGGDQILGTLVTVPEPRA